RDVYHPVGPGWVMLERRMRPLVWNAHPEPLEHAIRVLAPSDRNRRRRDRVLEDQIPTDDPRDKLTHRRVGIGIGAAGDGNHRGEFRVAETRKGAADAGDDERKHNRRTGAISN